MPATEQRTVTGLCMRWMPRAHTACARVRDHAGEHRSAKAMTDNRPRKTARRWGTRVEDDPAVKARWNRAYKFSRLGITEEEFNQLLADQVGCCAFCHLPFEESQRICADHDHDCCEMQPKARAKTCGKCIRGLLHSHCNTIVGTVELYRELTQIYLAWAAEARAARNN